MKHRQILTWFREKTAETILGVKKTKTNSRADDVPELPKYLTFSGHRRAGRTLIPKCPKVPFRKKKKFPDLLHSLPTRRREWPCSLIRIV